MIKEIKALVEKIKARMNFETDEVVISKALALYAVAVSLMHEDERTILLSNGNGLFTDFNL